MEAAWGKEILPADGLGRNQLLLWYHVQMT